MEKNFSTVACPKCKTPLPVDVYNAPAGAHCASCKASVEVTAFPALYREIEKGSAGEALTAEDESSCFYHHGKKATTVCEGCGRFLCNLCDVVLASRHLCPPCIEASQKKDKIPRLKKSRVLYDDVALSIAVLPMLILWFTPVTAPIAIYVAIRYWNAPSSVVPRTKIRFIIALILAVMQILGWLTLIIFMVLK